MATVATVVADLHIEGRSGDRLTTASFDGTRTLEVWLCDIGGGPRIAQLPPSIVHDVQWTDTRGGASSASFSIDRYAKVDPDGGDAPSNFWINRLLFDEDAGISELQIVWEGQVVHWGPIAAKKDRPGAARAGITLTDPQWYFGFRLANSAETIWSREFAKNPRFDFATPGHSYDTVLKETGVRSVILDDSSGGISRTIIFPFDGSARMRVRARVWVDSDTVGGGIRYKREQLSQNFTEVALIGPDTPRNQWVWITVEAWLHNPSVLPGVTTLTVIPPDSGTFRVDRLNAQVRPADLGVREQTLSARWMNPAAAAAGLILTGGDGVNITAVTDPYGPTGMVQAPWLTRNDMFVSEALRALAEGTTPGMEARMLYNDTLRAVEARALVGVVHEPETVTLRVAGGEGAGAHGNALSADIDSGVGKPTNRLRARGEDGFMDDAENLTKWGGVLFEDVVQAPIGVLDLASFANARIADNAGTTQGLRLDVGDIDLIAVLRRGDRVPVVIDDGPTQVDGLYRIESITCKPGPANPIQVDVIPWVAPPGEKPAMQARAVMLPSIEDGLVDATRRTFDLERRVSDIPPGIDRLEHLLDVDVAYTGDDAANDNDVLTWDADLERWIAAPVSSGGEASLATFGMKGDYDGSTIFATTEWDYGDTWSVTSGGDVAEVTPTKPGFYSVHAQIESGTGSIKIGNGGAFKHKFTDPEENFCRFSPVAIDTQSASVVMPVFVIDEEETCSSIFVQVTADAGVVEWSMQVFFVMSAPLIPGNCET